MDVGVRHQHVPPMDCPSVIPHLGFGERAATEESVTATCGDFLQLIRVFTAAGKLAMPIR